MVIETIYLWLYVTEKSVKFHEPGTVYELGFCMTHTSQSPRTLIIIDGFISNNEGHVADLRAHANTVSAVRKAQSPMDERRERSTCVSGFPMKATSATRAVAWCSDGMLDDPQKSDSTGAASVYCFSSVCLHYF